MEAVTLIGVTAFLFYQNQRQDYAGKLRCKLQCPSTDSWLDLANSEAVKKCFNKHPDAIAYIEKAAIDSSVKVLFAVE